MHPKTRKFTIQENKANTLVMLVGDNKTEGTNLASLT